MRVARGLCRRAARTASRPRLLVVAVLGGGLLAGVAAADQSRSAARPARHAPCPPAGTKVLARSRALVVYQGDQPGNRPVIVCERRRGARMTLVPPIRPSQPGFPHISVNRFELAGNLIGYHEAQFGVDSGTTRVVIADVAARRILRSIEGGHYADAGILFSEGVTTFVLSPSGAVAWTATRTDRRQLTDVVVFAAPRVGAPTVLDEGTTIDPSSLRLAGSTVSWSHGGVRRAAPMP